MTNQIDDQEDSSSEDDFVGPGMDLFTEAKEPVKATPVSTL